MAFNNSGSDLSTKDSAFTGEGKSDFKSIFLDSILVGGKITNQKLDVEGQQYIPWKERFSIVLMRWACLTISPKSHPPTIRRQNGVIKD